MTTRFGKLLEEIAGLSPSVLGEKSLARAIRERMSACKIQNEEQYLEKVRSSSLEMEALIEAVVVPETFFFRDKNPFTFLGRYVQKEWIPARGARRLRGLSAACSSGEEPYSIAIVLQEAGLRPGEYEIDGIDISRALLHKAERAAYSHHSFRGVPESLRDRYFLPAGCEYILKDTIRHGVRFIHGNLMDERVLAGAHPYDIIFCRNLLIYLGKEARARVVKTIERLLAQEGLLFVGHAETSSFPAARFVPLEHRGVFGFRKVEPGAAATTTEATPPQIFSSPPPAPIRPGSPERVGPPPTPAIKIPVDLIETAQQLADQGRLQEAVAVCERLLLADAANPYAYCLLGTVLHGMGNLGRAEECFTRAIYLDEHCHDAVLHLSLIKEHRGDLAGAEVLRRRAARIQTQTRTL